MSTRHVFSITLAVGLLVLALLSGCGRTGGPGIVTSPLLQQAERYLDKNDLAQVRKALDEYLQRTPSFGAYLNVLQLLQGKQQYGMMQEYADRALNDGRLKLNTLERATLWQAQGDAFSFSRRLDYAIPCYEETLKLAPNNAVALNNFAYALAELGERLEEAETMAKRALAQDPDNPVYLDTLGWIYFQQGRYRQAKQVLEQAVHDAPTEPELRYHLGMAHWALKRHPEARVELRKAINLWRSQRGTPYHEAIKALQMVEKGQNLPERDP